MGKAKRKKNQTKVDQELDRIHYEEIARGQYQLQKDATGRDFTEADVKHMSRYIASLFDVVI
jgi:hypothetical protein